MVWMIFCFARGIFFEWVVPKHTNIPGPLNWPDDWLGEFVKVILGKEFTGNVHIYSVFGLFQFSSKFRFRSFQSVERVLNLWIIH